MRLINEVPVLLLVLPIALLGFSGSALADEVIEGGLVEDSVRADVIHTWDGENSAWSSVPSGMANDVVGFRYEPVCFEDRNAGDLDCLRQAATCTGAPDGRLVWWFYGLRSVDPSTWARYSDTPSCIYSEDPAAFEERIREAALRAFQEAPIAPGTMTLQPSPHTLVGANTNVYVEASSQVFEMELLGQSVRIEVEPTEYTFNYGDGTNYGPVSTPGAPLPEARWGEQTATSHMYSQTGDFPVAVTTFFSGEYSVNGGPMIPMDGRAEVASPAQTLSVWRSESRNVADNCLVNPAGIGC